MRNWPGHQNEVFYPGVEVGMEEWFLRWDRVDNKVEKQDHVNIYFPTYTVEVIRK